MLTAMSADERSRKSKEVVDRLVHRLSNSPSYESMVIGVFAPMPDEPDWTQNPWLCRQKLCFPRLSGNSSMNFHQCRVDELVWQNDFGIKLLVPPEGAPQVQPDFVLVPGLAFDQAGYRLGRGGGFYDRWLADFEGKKIGLCFEEQLLQQLPHESHDIKVDQVITDKQILSL